MSLDLSKHERTVNNQCSVCGGEQFEYDENISDGNQPVKCVKCGRTIPYDELIKENSELINTNLDEMQNDCIKEIEKHFSDLLKKTFKGNKNIRIK